MGGFFGVGLLYDNIGYEKYSLLSCSGVVNGDVVVSTY